MVVNQGTFHPGLHGPGIVLRSSNLKEWEHIYTTTGPPANGSAVDCKLLALPDRLIFYYLYMHRAGEMEPSLPLPKPDVRNYVETRAVYTEDGQSWSNSQRVYEPLYNFWKPKVHNGVIYMAGDTFNVGRTDYVTAAEEANPSLYRVDLFRSADGLDWEKLDPVEVEEFKDIALAANAELWMTALTHRHARSGDGAQLPGASLSNTWTSRCLARTSTIAVCTRSSAPAAAITVAPMRLATWTQQLANPPVAPITRIVSPSLSSALRNSM